MQRLVGILPKAIARRCGTAAAPPARMGMVRRGGLRRAANVVVRDIRAANKRVTVMGGGATTPAAPARGRSKMRPVAHTPGQLAAAAAFVQAWQAPTPAPVAEDAGSSTASFDDERGTPSRRTLSFAESETFSETESSPGAPSPPRPRRRPWRRIHLALLACTCALASGHASFRRDPPRPVGLVLPVRGVGLADRLLM